MPDKAKLFLWEGRALFFGPISNNTPHHSCRCTTAPLASLATLSESRFLHLFKETTGLPLRLYILWRRIINSIEVAGQGAAIIRDFGLFDTPDAFYAKHRQSFSPLKGWLYRTLIRHWMNARVQKFRNGHRLKALSTFPYEANTKAAQT